MSESLEIVYYGKGFSKGKNGGQKPLTGVTIGRGEPIRAWLSAASALKGMGFRVDEAILNWTLTEEWENFKRKL